MPLQATIRLERLRCLAESDLNGHSEPYAWTVLIWQDDAVVMSPEVLGVSAPPSWSSARAVIERGIEAGDQADMPVTQRRFSHVFEDASETKLLAVVVVLWEQDDTPEEAVEAAYEVFVPELKSALIRFWVRTGEAPSSEADYQQIAEEVEPKVRDAVVSKLSGFQKILAALGDFNFDDKIGFDAFVMESYAPGDPNRTFTMRFELLDPAGPPNRYEIDGRLVFTRPEDPEACITEVERVRQARAEVDAVLAEIKTIEQDARDAATKAERSALIDEARRLKREELFPANARLEAAERALTRCRVRQPEQGPVLG